MPNDPSIQSMNYVQWMWCYSNIIEDKKQEEEIWRHRLKYMGIFVNPEAVKKVAEYENKVDSKGMSNKSTISHNNYEDESIYVNDEFEKEFQEAINGNKFVELPQGTYGDETMSADDFIGFVQNNINNFDDVKVNSELEADINDEDLDIIQINE